MAHDSPRCQITNNRGNIFLIAGRSGFAPSKLLNQSCRRPSAILRRGGTGEQRRSDGADTATDSNASDAAGYRCDVHGRLPSFVFLAVIWTSKRPRSPGEVAAQGRLAFPTHTHARCCGALNLALLTKRKGTPRTCMCRCLLSQLGSFAQHGRAGPGRSCRFRRRRQTALNISQTVWVGISVKQSGSGCRC